jgi:hypothetical protein
MKTNLIITGLFMAVIICSCSTPGYLPKSDDIDVNQYGSYITVLHKSGKYTRGELIAIDSNRLIILSSPGKNIPETPEIVPIAGISHFSVKYAKPKHYGWSIPVYTLATIGHGVFLIGTAPINLIVTIAVTAGGENSFEYSEREMTYEKLKMFARFPQGIPPDVNIAGITSNFK